MWRMFRGRATAARECDSPIRPKQTSHSNNPSVNGPSLNKASAFEVRASKAPLCDLPADRLTSWPGS